MAIITKGLNPYDFYANLIIRLVLKKRGTKPIFSNREIALKELEKVKETASPEQYKMPKGKKLCADCKESELGGFPLYTFTPKEDKPSEKHVLYLHGGAFVNQPTSWHWKAVAELTKLSGCTLDFFVYPKAPVYDYHLAYELIEGYYAKLLETVKPEDIVFMGDSAGAMMCVTLCEIFRSKGIPQPAKFILYSPVADTHLADPEIAEIYPKDPMQGVEGLKEYIISWAGGEDIYSPLFNPMATDLSALPKTVIFGGMREIFNPDVRVFTEKANEAGADVTFYQHKGLFHCFALFDEIAAKKARKLSAEIING